MWGTCSRGVTGAPWPILNPFDRGDAEGSVFTAERGAAEAASDEHKGTPFGFVSLRIVWIFNTRVLKLNLSKTKSQDTV